MLALQLATLHGLIVGRHRKWTQQSSKACRLTRFFCKRHWVALGGVWERWLCHGMP